MAILLRLTAITLLIVASPVLAGERDQLNACKTLVAAQSSGGRDTPEVTRCRQIIKEWTLRDSRMSVDEQGRPLR
ncbi:hypothetical protein JQ615_37370 [Bradyrhizobium jicamae]|uniref:Uncharacterized protein n=1 Tax=Bradyrhizobium jicamae TaxID=280332 RepID=A0ABS5FXR8_9BRAD|nr:hypothetical protein [Bradyrhizobium jicamae]MBR0801046.1 hypothetical protein [Bradyrhizobium jicamae]MBR0937389.1 hypothetical protein [Bradyrhizobium jicamae]